MAQFKLKTDLPQRLCRPAIHAKAAANDLELSRGQTLQGFLEVLVQVLMLKPFLATFGLGIREEVVKAGCTFYPSELIQ